MIEVVAAGGHIYRPEPSYFETQTTQRALFESLLGSETLRRLDDFSQCALFALEHARRSADACRTAGAILPERCGVCVGTGLGAQTTRVRYARRLAQLGPAATNPIDFPDSIDGAAAAHVAMRWGLTGPSLTFADGSAAAHNALVAACRQIALGRADRMCLVIGDVFEPSVRANLEAAMRPVDAVFALILEKLETTRHAALPRITGFLGASRPHEATREWRDVTPPKASRMDLSGVLNAAEAWLRVSAPVGNAVAPCQDETEVALSSNVISTMQSSLSFWRKVENR